MHKGNKIRAIGIFAHNEAKNIITCLESVKKAIKVDDECFVLNNGSSDNTGELIEEFSRSNSFCKIVTIKIGDKSNAWNVFVHDLGINADLFIFLDGDCEVASNSLDSLENSIAITPLANAAAALPSIMISPRNREEMLRNGGLAGNLYALSARFVKKIRETNTRLPVGLIGDDSLVGALAYWDLNPMMSWDKSRIVMCEDASFSYSKLSPLSIGDIRFYLRRKIRYSLRYFQTQLMKNPLKKQGLSAIPRSINEVYFRHASEVKITWRGIDTLFDYIAAKRIKRCIEEYSNDRPNHSPHDFNETKHKAVKSKDVD